MIRLLIVDDSPTARALMHGLFSEEAGVCIVGEAADGLEAIRLARSLRPDVITMDVSMPGLDGFATTKEIMMSVPTPIVIVSDCAKGAQATATAMKAIEMGAVAVLSKPPGPLDPQFSGEAGKLIATVRSMSSVKVVRHWRPPQTPHRHTKNTYRGEALALAEPVRCVAIAASTGGPAALQQILSTLPAQLEAPVFIVQHIAAGFTPGLVDWLATTSAPKVVVASTGIVPRPGCVYVAPDNHHLSVDKTGKIALLSSEPVRGFRPSATPLFDSLAKFYGESLLAVILTGMGDDGVEGLREVKRRGGKILAQDEATSVVYGMPKAALESGLPDWVMPLGIIAQSLRDTLAKIPRS